MSWKKCYSGSNNLYLDHPPIMNDGRNFATLRPDEQINQDVLDENKIMSSSAYRSFLMRNADHMITNNQIEACSTANCFRGFKKPEGGQQNQPYFYVSAFDNTKPFGYSDSDMKNVYLTREQLQSRMVAPTLKIEK